MSPGENLNQALECNIQGNCLAACCTVVLSPTAKIAVIKLSCTMQYEVLDIELWRCLPRHWNDHKSKCTAAGLCVHTVALEFQHPHRHTLWHKPFFLSCRLMFLSFCLLSLPFLFHPDLQLGSGEASVSAGKTRRPISPCTSVRRAKCMTWLTCLRTRRSPCTAGRVELNTGWWS